MAVSEFRCKCGRVRVAISDCLTASRKNVTTIECAKCGSNPSYRPPPKEPPQNSTFDWLDYLNVGAANSKSQLIAFQELKDRQAEIMRLQKSLDESEAAQRGLERSVNFSKAAFDKLYSERESSQSELKSQQKEITLLQESLIRYAAARSGLECRLKVRTTRLNDVIAANEGLSDRNKELVEEARRLRDESKNLQERKADCAAQLSGLDMDYRDLERRFNEMKDPAISPCNPHKETIKRQNQRIIELNSMLYKKSKSLIDIFYEDCKRVKELEKEVKKLTDRNSEMAFDFQVLESQKTEAQGVAEKRFEIISKLLVIQLANCKRQGTEISKLKEEISKLKDGESMPAPTGYCFCGDEIFFKAPSESSAMHRLKTFLESMQAGLENVIFRNNC